LEKIAVIPQLTRNNININASLEQASTTGARIQNIQALRGIAALLVVSSHMLRIEGKYAQFDYLLPDFLMIGNSGVDLFFVISGFVMVFVTRGTFQHNEPVNRFLYCRFTRIYPLYWFYSTLILCAYIVQPTLVNSSQGNRVNIIASYLLIPQDLLPLVNVGWTLIYEIYFYIAFALLLLLPKTKFLFGLIFWGTCIVAANIYFGESNNAFLHVYRHPLTLEFIAGCLIAELYFNRPLFGNAKAVTLLAIVMWILTYYAFREITGKTAPTGWIRIMVFGVPALITLYGALLFESKHQMVMPRWLCRIGDASYSIYLSHVIVLTILGRIWISFAKAGGADNVLAIIVMTAAVLAAGFLSYRLIETRLLNITRKFDHKYLRHKS
jgi:exopolysaccharide production protein ExoZ